MFLHRYIRHDVTHSVIGQNMYEQVGMVDIGSSKIGYAFHDYREIIIGLSQALNLVYLTMSQVVYL